MATTVTLIVMRTWLKERLAGLADSLSDDQVDDYIEYAYRFMIPHEIPGYLTDGEWSQATTQSVATYNLGSTIHSVQTPVLLDGNELETFTRIENWYFDHDPTDTTENQPTRALIYGTENATYPQSYGRPTIHLYPVPDSTVYTLSGAARLYPTIDLSTSDGETLLADTVLVKAILSGAALERALDVDEDVITKRETGRFRQALQMLSSRSLTPAQERRYQRTF